MRSCVTWFLFYCACTPEQRLVDRTTPPLRPASQVETVARFDFPPMHVAISRGGRIFMDALVRDRDSPIKTIELKDGKLVPFPDPTLQRDYATVHGIHVDSRDRLWILDHGNYSLAHKPRLYGYDISTGKQIENYTFPSAVAAVGSMLNDIVVDVLHEVAFISDTGSFIGDSAVVLFDIKHRTSRRLLAGHPSLSPAPFDIHVENRPFRILRFIRPKLGIDGIALDSTNRWLYYSAFNRGELYRIPVAAALDATLDAGGLAGLPEKVADITMSDGMLFDHRGALYLSDVEHSAIVRVTPAGRLETVFKDPVFHWPVGYARAPDGQIYFTCSAIDQVQLKSRKEVLAGGPYFLYRFRPD
jgi:sugar lactone lactonase YvrE